ncbi:pre-mRNA-splicing factor cwc24 [Aspergillus lentulus]|uniref:Pre-mRNA-splicing factor CWC24 n=1 Tax=Aspergillus lentulus TaxID=293939 RepID=A0AAN4PM87_ASPLE|nr:pre-mRNA-splicing factor cwc24 [Aspergillus lentulus]GAQ09283.1 pre-mRNA-splicing factor cwc24 [Aspergillus lentulus]GFF33879.1 pre-mRNA-splicing factor cwc24 [Aspergillus lentulus]GFF64558.1 pre-mRNA-splicing factor cwc24 [Aspergillus lentulus]
MAEETQAADAVPQISFKKRTNKAKANFRKKPDTPPPASGSDSDFTSSDDEEGRRIKRRRKNVAVTASSATAGPRRNTVEDQPATETAAIPLTSSNDATKHSNWYDEELSEKNLLGTTRARPASSTPSAPDGTYKGTANYSSFIQKNPNAPTKQFGPIKAPTNVRTVTVMDFAPDVCKDWKQTGFCGFGDSCKFLHAREDYKQGWELDREWEIGTKGKQLSGRVVSKRSGDAKTAEDDEDDDDEELLESIPFACIICKSSYKSPIITKCGHYFCESCALQRYRKNPSCAACGAGTGGVFNVAKKLNHLLDKKRERARKLREQAIAEGEEVSSDEEEGDEES